MANAFPGPIQHVVVLMLENRSYDNILGALYADTTPPSGQSTLNGLAQEIADGTVANQTTPTQMGTNTTPTYPPTCIPIYDPGEYFCDMAQQIMGTSEIPDSYPYGTDNEDYPPAAAQAMTGFLTNYSQIGGLSHPTQASVPAENLPDVMNYFTPDQLPVTSFLAQNFGVSDVWFASVPSQTFTNRTFVLCAAPAVHTEILGHQFSLVDDPQYLTDSWSSGPSLLDLLDNALPSNTALSPPYWKVYFHDHSLGIETVDTLDSLANQTTNSNLATFDNSDWPAGQIPSQLSCTSMPTTFVEDVLQSNGGSLPPFAFIEPRYFNDKAYNPLPPNSNHPGGSNYPSPSNLSGVAGNTNPPIDVAMGELLLMQVYNLLQASDYWGSTLLIITYDEHGGVYDHVVPPTATAPDVPAASNDADGAVSPFNFAILGGRVPAILISQYIDAASTVRPQGGGAYDHTTIIQTVRQLFAPNAAPLTARDQNAASLTGTNGVLQPTAVNQTGPYAGALVAAPGTLVFTNTTPQTAFASAGVNPAITVTDTTGDDWFTWSANFTTLAGGTTSVAITVTPNSGLSGNYNGSITVTGGSSAGTATINLFAFL